MESKKNFVMKKSLYLLSIVFIFCFISFFVSAETFVEGSLDLPQDSVQDSTSLMIDDACGYYRGYYDMSGDMGSLIFKLGLLFFVLEVIHKFLSYGFDLLIVKFKKKDPEPNSKLKPVDSGDDDANPF